LSKILLQTKEFLNSVLFSTLRFLLLVLFVPSIFVHELGHLGTALLVGIRIESFDIGEGEIKYEFFLRSVAFRLHEIPIGGGVLVKSDEKKYASWQVIFLLLAGLLMNLLISLICFLMVKNPTGWIYGAINLCFVIFALCPISGSDGYRCYQLLRGKVPDSMEQCDKVNDD